MFNVHAIYLFIYLFMYFLPFFIFVVAQLLCVIVCRASVNKDVYTTSVTSLLHEDSRNTQRSSVTMVSDDVSSLSDCYV